MDEEGVSGCGSPVVVEQEVQVSFRCPARSDPFLFDSLCFICRAFPCMPKLQSSISTSQLRFEGSYSDSIIVFGATKRSSGCTRG